MAISGLMTNETEAGAGSATLPDAKQSRPGRLVLDRVTLRADDGTVLIEGVDFVAEAGELVAIVGASGSGKSTMLDALAGTVAPTSGTATIDGVDAHRMTASQRRGVGFVPQADVLHEDLPVGRMLNYSGRLRLPRGSSRDDVRTATADALDVVALAETAGLVVRQLSGGQRRRVSLALELLTGPDVCLLDEPTSGLDPATAETVVDELRTLADAGKTVVFVTHNANDLRRCDRIVALERGHIVFDGTPRQAMCAAGSNDTDDVHRALTNGLIHNTVEPAPVPPAPIVTVGSVPRIATDRAAGPSRLTQWWVLTTRTLESVWRNRLTLAIMVGSPAMVIAMFAILFQPAAFDPASPSPTATIMIAFWVAFGGFFFGLTYGLLQICPEVATIKRERRAGVSPGLQVAAKLAALTPILLVIDGAMLVVLRMLDRLPAAGFDTYSKLAITLALDALAALALGLLASALVRNPAQASLALPMLCFPAVLFSGAVLAVPVMAPVGRAISAAMPDRWAFELIGRDLGLRRLFADDPSALGPALLDEYGDTWTASHGNVWLLLAGFTVGLSIAAAVALERRCRRADRHATHS